MTTVHATQRSKGQLAARSPSERPPAHRPSLRLIQPGTQVGFDRSCIQAPELPLEGIGSQDAAAAIGLHPFKSPVRLRMELTGRKEHLQAVNAKEAPSTFWSKLFDPIVAASYTRCTGRRVRRINAVIQHPEHLWMTARIEREVLDQSDVQLLSYRFVGRHEARAWHLGMPDHVRVQALHTLAVSGQRAIDLAVLICGEELQIHRVVREEAVIERLVALEGSFWHHVQLDKPPPEDYLDPEVVRRVLCGGGTPRPSLQHRLTTGDPFEPSR